MNHTVQMQTSILNSGRYGGGRFDLRSLFLKFCGILQRKKVMILDSDPELCREILSISDRKGTFIEYLIATPAWAPILSAESVDGDLWRQISSDFRQIFNRIQWRERLSPILEKYLSELDHHLSLHPNKMIHSEEISRITLRVLFELVFETRISKDDETLFYQASVEWRKEIGVKGRGNKSVKSLFWKRLEEIIQQSQFGEVLRERDSRSKNKDTWISAIAQPFIISPQINVSDIMVAVFHFLRSDPDLFERCYQWAKENDRARLGGVLLEAIRLQHPFPLLERELKAGTRLPSGRQILFDTQFFFPFDRFQQDNQFQPERWLKSSQENPYSALPFGAGPRMCTGKPIAMELMTEFLKAFLIRFSIEKIQPQILHLYSGRINDKTTSWRESLYQLKIILGGVYSSFTVSKKANSSTKRCPFQSLFQWLD